MTTGKMSQGANMSQQNETVIKKNEHSKPDDGDENIIAELCAFAPSNEIRDVLRIFQSDKTTLQIKTLVGRRTKTEITNTLEYLGIAGNNGDKKDACVFRLMNRVTNLQPKKCVFCHKKYKVDKDDLPLLPCKRCGQDVHKQCIMDTLKIDEKDITQDTVKKMLNPYGIASLHHLCVDCEDYMTTKDTTITNAKKIIGKKKENENEDKKEHNACNMERDQESTVHKDCSSDCKDQIPTIVSIDRGLVGSEMMNHQRSAQHKIDVETSNSTSHSETSEDDVEEREEHDDDIPICNHYKAGKCKHGRKGENCEFRHPKPCRKLMQHGNKSPRGCNAGMKCKSFHPRMCRASITKGKCFDNKCTFVHVKGTVRKKPNEEPNKENMAKQQDLSQHRQESNRTTTTQASQPDQTGMNDFLSLLHNFKIDVMEAMDHKINNLMASHATEPQLAVPSNLSTFSTHPLIAAGSAAMQQNYGQQPQMFPQSQGMYATRPVAQDQMTFHPQIQMVNPARPAYQSQWMMH